jgi:hypothetical protein
VSSMGCMVPQLFAAGGNWPYLDFWVITGDPRYLGYKTPTVAPEPFVERLAEAIPAMGGRICTHMILWVPPMDWEV